MKVGKPKQIFLSHSIKDHVFVQKLAAELRRQHLPVWISTHHLIGAQAWQDEIGRALHASDWFLIVLSPHSVKSMWVKRELQYALSEQRLENRIVPVLLKRCQVDKLSWTLSNIQQIDFTHHYLNGLKKLLKIWKL